MLASPSLYLLFTVPGLKKESSAFWETSSVQSVVRCNEHRDGTCFHSRNWCSRRVLLQSPAVTTLPLSGCCHTHWRKTPIREMLNINSSNVHVFMFAKCCCRDTPEGIFPRGSCSVNGKICSRYIWDRHGISLSGNHLFIHTVHSVQWLQEEEEIWCRNSLNCDAADTVLIYEDFVCCSTCLALCHQLFITTGRRCSIITVETVQMTLSVLWYFAEQHVHVPLWCPSV